MIGLDTGFFIELLNGNEEAARVWKSGLTDGEEFLVSALTLFEIERLGLKGKLRDWKIILEAISGAAVIVWLAEDTLSLAARLSHGLGIPSMDSLILASLVSGGVAKIFTTDSHFEAYESGKVVVRNLRRGG